MRVELMRNEPELLNHLNAIAERVAGQFHVPTVSLGSGLKKRPIPQARQAYFKLLRMWVQQYDTRTRATRTRDPVTGRVMYRTERQSFYRVFGTDGRVVYQTPGTPPYVTWRPLSAPRIAGLLGLDHSTVIRSLGRKCKGEQACQTQT